MKNVAKGKNEKELTGLLKEKREALSDFSSKAFQGQVKNVKEGRSIRKQIAQIMTALTEESKKSNSSTVA
jgi:ribosomal protein L29